MKKCCNHSKKDKKCIRNDKKTFKLPRRFSKKKCKKKCKKIKGFTMRSSCAPYKNCFKKTKMKQKGGKKKIAYFSGGCFWGLEKKFKNVVGVKKTQVGYMGGKTKKPTYELVSSGKTNYAETIKLNYNNKIVTYEDLLSYFFNFHDPTTLNRQGPDIGKQYRSILFYKNKKEKEMIETVIKKLSQKKKIVTEIFDSNKYKFYKAEKHHQNYLDKKKTKYLTPLGIKWVKAASEDMKKRIQSQEGGKKDFLKHSV
jgi:peptide-methionine (S)-S-oxide reductase